MDVITIRAFTRVMFTYVRYSYKIEGARENKSATSPYSTSTVVERPQVPMSHHRAWSKERPLEHRAFHQWGRQLPESNSFQTGKTLWPCAFWGQAWYSPGSKTLWTHKTSAQGELENLWPRYLQPYYWISDVFRSLQIEKLSLPKSHDLGIGKLLAKCRKGKSNLNSSLMKETALLKFLCFM